MKEILSRYGLNAAEYSIENFGVGLINHTWLISNGNKYILQKINRKVFTNPLLIDENICSLADYLKLHKTSYHFIKPKASLNGKTIVFFEDEYYRLIKFIPSKTYSVVNDASIAFEAAKQFGRFTKNLSGFNADKLHQTIPHFHDIKLRYNQFEEAVEIGNRERIHQSKKIIQALQKHKNIADTYNDILQNPAFKKRVTHHDTKISNVLFDEHNKGIAVIDLDTVMPGYFISDVGDMLRTYLSPVGEEEINFDLIEVRDDYFKAVAEGYLSEMKNELSNKELNAFVYAGKFMIYMQALRFITDYFNDDVYYGAAYPLQNFNRAQNQLCLLKCLVEKEDSYNLMVKQLTIDY